MRRSALFCRVAVVASVAFLSHSLVRYAEGQATGAPAPLSSCVGGTFTCPTNPGAGTCASGICRVGACAGGTFGTANCANPPGAIGTIPCCWNTVGFCPGSYTERTCSGLFSNNCPPAGGTVRPCEGNYPSACNAGNTVAPC